MKNRILKFLRERRLGCRVLFCLIFGICCEVEAADTSFRYQGRLNEGGKPANGAYDLRINVYDVAAGAGMILGSITRTNVVVTDGLFDLMVDVGDVFDGSTRWLEIATRTNGPGAFVTLSPRQKISTVPYSTFAATSASATYANAAATASNAIKVASGSVTSTSIAPGGLSATNIAAEQVVKSINGLRDNVLLVAGPGVSLSNNANTVVLSATNPFVSGTTALLNANQTFTGLNAFNGGIQVGANTNIQFGAQTRQMLNLYSTAYGVGVQSGTMYFRSDGGFANSGKFAWYRGGVHNDGMYNPGGGETLMTLEPGGLSVGGGIGAGGGITAGGDLRLPDVTRSVLGITSYGFNGIGVYGASLGRTFAGQAIEGPVLIGGSGGGLGLRNTILGSTSEKLVMQWNGNELTADVIRGLVLNAFDGPLVTRGWDPFSSTAGTHKAGLGRWGVFMDQGTMVLGCPGPDVGERGIELARYAVDGSRTPLLRLSNIDGTATFAGGISSSNISCPQLVVSNTLYAGAARISGILYINNNVQMADARSINAGGCNAYFRYVNAEIISQTSDRNKKEGFRPIDGEEVLAKVAALPISEWNFKDDKARHVGPMAQDFRAAFGLGATETGIATVDADGVALAAIQGLHKKVREKEGEIQELKKRLEKLERLLDSREERGAN